MSERKVIRFYIAPSWDGMSYNEYTYAPEGWDDMSPEEQEEFLNDESETFLAERIEYGAYACDPKEEAEDAWRTGGSPSEPEDWFAR